MKLHIEEIHKLYSSPSTIRMFKSSRMRCPDNVARMEEEECLENFGEKPRRKETTRKS
jgi:hypothetical protein